MSTMIGFAGISQGGGNDNGNDNGNGNGNDNTNANANNDNEGGINNNNNNNDNNNNTDKIISNNTLSQNIGEDAAQHTYYIDDDEDSGDNGEGDDNNGNNNNNKLNRAQDKHVKTSKVVEEELMCAICCDYADNAVEAQCCHKLFCEDCVTEWMTTHRNKSRKCPVCCETVKFVPTILGRRLINALPAECPNYCDTKHLVRGDLKKHLEWCPNRSYTCSYPKCVYSGISLGYQHHIQEVHGMDSIKAFDIFWKNQSSADHKENEQDSNSLKSPIEDRLNSKGRMARLGETGKFYCNGKLFDCGCCNGYCGPEDGCNCVPCMQLDVTTRKLLKDHLINKDGHTSRYSPDKQKWYCGCRVGDKTSTWDGYCGPTSGPNCRACEVLGNQAKHYCKKIWNWPIGDKD